MCCERRGTLCVHEIKGAFLAWSSTLKLNNTTKAISNLVTFPITRPGLSYKRMVLTEEFDSASAQTLLTVQHA